MDDFMETLIEALDTDADVFESDRQISSDPWFGKQKFSLGPNGIKFGNPMDIFDMFFGGGDPFGRGGGRRGPRRTKNLVHQLSVSLEDMYNGTTRKLALQKNVICDSCEGVGGKAGAVQKCPNCRGTGMQVRIQQLGPGMMQQIQSMCQVFHNHQYVLVRDKNLFQQHNSYQC